MIWAADTITTTRPSVRRLVDERDDESLQRMCGTLARLGASWIDLNPGRVKQADRERVWRFLVEGAEKACDCTLMIDTSSTYDMSMAVQMCSRPPVLNLTTAEDSRLGPVLDIAAHHDIPVIAATMTSHVPVDAQEKLALASVIVQAASERGIEGDGLILDPMVMPIRMVDGERHARAVLEVIRTIPALFDPAPRTIAALSNLTTRCAGSGTREAAAPYLAALCGAGLDIVLMDWLDDQLRQTARMCRVFEAERIYASGR